MSRESCPVKLEERQSGKLVEAMLYEGISEENLEEYQSAWVPAFEDAIDRARKLLQKGKDASHPAEDSHWDWRDKVLSTQGSLSHKHFALECEGRTQGLMQIELTLHRSRIEPGQHLVYIDYLAVAPWNRRTIEPNPRFRSTGTVLFYQAIGTSLDEGFFGRIGLHALPAAADWYRLGFGMQSFGPDEHKSGLEYFELSQDKAKELIQNMATK